MQQELRQIPGYGTVEVPNQLIEDLRGMIRASAMTFEQIGEIAHVHPNTISRWVSGDTKSPQLLKVASVAEALGYRLTFVPTLQQGKHH